LSDKTIISSAADSSAAFASLLLFSRLLLFRRLASNAAQHFLEGFLSSHLLAASFVFSVFVFGAASPTSRLLHLFTSHCYDGVIGGALATRAIVIDIIAKSGHR
jgi:phytoene dehydrogenase-like protein